MTGLSRRQREWLRFHVAWKVSWPLWLVKQLGDRAGNVHDRLITWGERA